MLPEHAGVESADPREDGRVLGPLGLTRRAALLLPALVVAACSSDPGTASTGTLANGPSAVLPSMANEADLIAQYESVIAAFPQLAQSLQPICEQHRAHLTALGGSEPASASAGPATAARSVQAALTQLAEAEKAAAQQRLQDCIAATGEPVIRTLASIAASEASHVVELVSS